MHFFPSIHLFEYLYSLCVIYFTRWYPLVISWFIIPMNYRYNPLINPSYWTYLHQVSVHDLGHHHPVVLYIYIQ